MGLVPVPGRKAVLREVGEALEVEMPSKRGAMNYAAFGFPVLIVGLVGPALVRAILGNGEREPAFFMLAFIIPWALGGLGGLLGLLWTAFGRERMTLGPATLRLRREIFGIGPDRDHDLSNVARLRFSRRFLRSGPAA